jgi:hypothetical protein
MRHQGSSRRKTAVSWVAISFLLCVSVTLLACGSGTSASSSNPLSGNWEITLQRHAHPSPFVFTGFLLQSGSSVTGSMILGGGCQGVGPVAGTLEGANLSLTISEFGQDISLIGTLPPGSPSGSTFVGGAFSSVAGGCADYASTGTWSAVSVTPIAGSFHGSLVSTVNGTLEVAGTLSQGPNTGSSNATLSGTITATSAPSFCPYLSTATITGLISGTTVTLDLFGPNGSLIAQIPATVTSDGSSLTGSYTFPEISSSCVGDTGTLQLTFP